MSLHALKMVTDATGSWDLQRWPPSSARHVSYKAEASVHLSERFSALIFNREGGPLSTGPKGSAEPEISKFLSALTELLLSQVSGSSKSECCHQTDSSGLRMQAFFLIKVKAWPPAFSALQLWEMNLFAKEGLLLVLLKLVIHRHYLHCLFLLHQ